jgi:acyl-CoA reductase-like NAD-dependent aldehyde dehydrogenase
MISPLVGAIAAGNCALLKPSELAPATSRVIANLIGSLFDPSYVAVVEGGVETSQALLEEKFDHIFFTGGTAIGKLVMAAAAKHLTPVTLELGGKSPCIIDADIQVEYTAKRIAWGKFLNAGQTCVAPDYLLVDRRVKPALMQAIATTLHQFYGDNPAESPDYGRIVSPRHFSRLESLLQDGNIVIGGQSNPADRYIAPTVMEVTSLDDRIMQEEIFGPILPVVEYDQLEEAIALINSKSKPLALYIFSKDSHFQDRVLAETSSGGVCINDTIMQLGVSELPFGGVGESGIGRYHGKAGFDTFSHFKSVLRKPFWLELPWRYAPYAGKLDLVKKIIK